LADALNIPTWNVKKLIDQAKHFSEASLQEGVFKCHQTDLAVREVEGQRSSDGKLVMTSADPAIPPSPSGTKVRFARAVHPPRNSGRGIASAKETADGGAPGVREVEGDRVCYA